MNRVGWLGGCPPEADQPWAERRDPAPHYKLEIFSLWWVGRAVEGADLENQRGRNALAGSNPAPTAK